MREDSNEGSAHHISAKPTHAMPQIEVLLRNLFEFSNMQKVAPHFRHQAREASCWTPVVCVLASGLARNVIVEANVNRN